MRQSSAAKQIDPNQAVLRFRKLNSFGRAHESGSHLSPVHCVRPDNPIKFNQGPENTMQAFRDEFHSLFMRICQIGLQLCDRGMNNDADRVFEKLMFALKKYPGLSDDRKRGALQNMANFHTKMGNQDECEWILMMDAEVAGPYDTAVHQEDSCQRLANSMAVTCGTTNCDLREHWKTHFMVPGETSLAVHPIPRSAQHRNAGIASKLSANPNSSPPALFNQEGLHIAAIHGHEQTITSLLLAGAEVDATDIHHQTALFLAAKKGHEGSCAELLKFRANPNERNHHGNTILEVAAGAGHFSVVQQLVKAGAEVNAEIMCCTSSPLQAAIENPKAAFELVLYLIARGADVSTPRNDGTTAMDLAERRHPCLARILRQELQGQQNFFGQTQLFSFDRSHLDPF